MVQQLDVLIRQHDEVEAAAYQELVAAAPIALAQGLGLQIQKIAGATLLIASGIPSPIFNRVIGAGNRQTLRDADLDAFSAAYQQAGVTQWWLHVSPSTANEQLAARLAARGFTLAERRSWAKVVRDNAPLASVDTQAQIRLLQDGEEDALAETICVAFEMPVAMAPWFASLAKRPNWQVAVATSEDKIVGGGFLHVQGKQAWFGAGGVRQEARRLHAHRALLALRTEQAIAAGCTQLFTETGEAIADEPNPSLRNMHACGFVHGFSRLNYAAPI